MAVDAAGDVAGERPAEAGGGRGRGGVEVGVERDAAGERVEAGAADAGAGLVFMLIRSAGRAGRSLAARVRLLVLSGAGSSCFSPRSGGPSMTGP